MNNWWKQQAEELKAKKFLQEHEDHSSLRTDLHHTKFWADSFWGRRDSHVRRLDPEIAHIKQLQPQSILEIGAAYGRIINKIIKEYPDETPELTGIDVCTHFAPYFDKYKQDNPHLEKVKMVYDDFFKTDKLGKYDMIMLPMNTFPSFPKDTIKPLLETVREYLKPEGTFLFSTYKYPKDEDAYIREMKNNYHGGEFLAGQENHLIVELLRNKVIKQDYGIHGSSFQSINRVSRKYELLERAVFHTGTNWYNPSFLRSIIEKNGFKIQVWDDTSHSLVVGIS